MNDGILEIGGYSIGGGLSALTVLMSLGIGAKITGLTANLLGIVVTHEGGLWELWIVFSGIALSAVIFGVLIIGLDYFLLYRLIGSNNGTKSCEAE